MPRNAQDVQLLKRYQYFTQAMVQLSFHLHVLRAIALKRMGRGIWKEKLSAGLDISKDFFFARPISPYAVAVLPLLQECGWNKDAEFWDTVISATRRQATLYPDYLTPRLEMAAPLSGAELQVLHLLCTGKSNTEIGSILGIKLATVKTHISHIFDKLHVRRRSEVKDVARRLHLVSME